MAQNGVYGSQVQMQPSGRRTSWYKDAYTTATVAIRPYGGQSASQGREIPKHKPIAMFTFLLVNVIVFIYEMSESGWKMAPYKVNPMLGPEPGVLASVGAKDARLIKNGEEWRLFTPMWMHAGLIHLAMNMLVLFNLGFGLENLYGTLRITPIYILSGLGGNMASAIFLPTCLSVGASGALFGLFGAQIADYTHNHIHFEPEQGKKYLRSIVLWSVIGLILGLIPFMDNFAHIGGFMTGILTGFITLYNPPVYRREEYFDEDDGPPKHGKWLLLAGIVSTCVWFIILFSLLFGDNPDSTEWCPGCQYLSCIPSSFYSCNCSWQPEDIEIPVDNGDNNIANSLGKILM